MGRSELVARLRCALLGCALLGCALLAGCTVPGELLTDRPCPCADGWSCDPDTNLCVEGELPPPEDAGPPADTGAGDDASTADSGPGDAGPVDAGPPEPPPSVPTTCWSRAETCDWTADFELVLGDPSVIATADPQRNVTFSPDGCELYSSDTSRGYVATRSGPGAAFGPSVPLPGLEAEPASRPSITPDGLQLYFQRPGATLYETWRATRPRRGGSWLSPELVPELTREDAHDYDGILAPHGLRFYWSPSAGGDQDVWMAERASLSAPFGSAGPVPLLSGAGRQSEPAVTADERLVVLLVGDSLSYATRPHWRAPWSPPLLAPGAPLVAPDETESTVSPDGCEVLVQLDRRMTYLVYQAR
ncbi:MAG: hypothetical protein VYE22_18455 [Myxococcota bacterium]|nr:hypothetical protein [Myxococcota bacterium]